MAEYISREAYQKRLTDIGGKMEGTHGKCTE